MLATDIGPMLGRGAHLTSDFKDANITPHISPTLSRLFAGLFSLTPYGIPVLLLV